MTKFERMLRTIPGFYRAEVNTILGGILKAFGVSDDDIMVQLKNTKDQLYVTEANARDLEALGNNVGVDKSPELGLEDNAFRELIPVLSFFPKQVRQTIVALLDVFWGVGFTRPNLNSGNIEPFNFGPSSLAGGTANFVNGRKIIKGTGTSFLTSVSPGEYIKPTGAPGTSYQKVSAVLDDVTIELSSAWTGDVAINADVEIGPIRTISYIADGGTETTIRFTPDFFTDLTAVTIDELTTAINDSPEHNVNITASKFIDPISGSRLNIRTNTPGLQGAIQITGGDANTSGRLNFTQEVQTETKVRVVEVNPNEIVIQIPSSVPVLRRSLRGSSHPRESKTVIQSNREVFNFASLGATSTLEVEVEGTAYVVNFNHSQDFEDPTGATVNEVATVINSQLTFLQALDSCNDYDTKRVVLQTTEGSAEYQVTGGTANAVLGFTTDLQTDPDLIETAFPSAYIFDPVGQLFTVTGINSELTNQIVTGNVASAVNVDDASGFPNAPGRILFNFGRSQQEGPISYTARPNNNTLLIDASYIFQNTHDVGRKVNLISNRPSLPRLTGADYPVYVVGTQEARAAAQDLIRKLLAAGVVIRFIVEFPEFLFECTCEGCEISDDADLRGTLTDSSPLVF